MPKIVDHEQRRREVAAAVLPLVARDGLAAVTLKSVATDAGWSTGVVNHYFDGKADLIAAAVEYGLEALLNHSLGAAEEPDCRAALAGVMCARLPLDPMSEAMTRVKIAFLAEAVLDDRLTVIMTTHQMAWRQLLTDIVERGVESGELAPDLDVDYVTETLAALTYGLADQALFEAIPRTAQIGLVERWIPDTVGGPRD
ncbi:MAG: TetR family transcriptional regulator [Actinomycetia bacterium]|nr:TetR family transcriptional regulator [Actinomycetes bacterium]